MRKKHRIVLNYGVSAFLFLDAKDNKGRDGSLDDAFKPLQVGITNPTPAQQSGSISPNASRTGPVDEVQRVSRPASSSGNRDSSPKTVSSPVTVPASTVQERPPSPSSKASSSIQKIQEATPIAPAQAVSTSSDYEQGQSLRIFSFRFNCLLLV